MTPLYVGVMSGTSLDGLDLVLAAFPDPVGPHDPGVQCLAGGTWPLGPQLRTDLAALAREPSWSPERFLRADAALGEAIGTAVLELLRRAGAPRDAVAAIGSHGQTIRHAPDARPPATLQIGDPNRIAERTELTVVADFRRRDVAAGGQGAPLVPPFHARLFGRGGTDRAVLNVGGIANATLLPAHHPEAASGFDTGPGNTLLDRWTERHRGTPFDRDGAWAESGEIRPELLDRLLEDPWFRRTGPRSTGPEHFHPQWLEGRAGDLLGSCPPADVQATLTELTAVAAARAVQETLPGAEIVVCGGGRRNRRLMRRLEAHAQAPVRPCEDLGVDGDLLEALAFAWLARERLAGRASSAPAVTGARGPRVLGAVYAPGRADP